jgi:hypothetical protein
MNAIHRDEDEAAWPALPLEAWSDTYHTLHMWLQIIGKVRMAYAPLINHWWNVTLYVTPRGLTTTAFPLESGAAQIDVDFLAHEVVVSTSDGELRKIPLEPMTVFSFYSEIMNGLGAIGVRPNIWPVPVEVPDPIPFTKDTLHRSYDSQRARDCWVIMLHSARVFERFRSEFLGKVSPVHFFWGGFDLAVSRFSGRPAPPHGPVPNVANFVVREAYSHEVSSIGFWPGGAGLEEPVYYSYVYPEPPGYADRPVRPSGAYYNRNFGEFILPYEAVRRGSDPDALLLEFARSTYDAAADGGEWDRAALERL